MEKEKILLKVHRSWKVHLPFYILIFVILGYIGYSYHVGNFVSRNFIIFSSVIIILIIGTTEIHRIRDWWAITENSFIESKSILDKNVREIEFQTIADIALDQPLLKRIFNFGTIEIRKFLNETSIIIPNIDNPEKFINILRDAIRKDSKNEKRTF